MKPINKTYYYALQNRILRFNKVYGEKIKQTLGEEYLLSLDIFKAIKGVWYEIAEDETKKEGATNLPKDHHISDKSFKKLEDEAKMLYDHLSYIAVKAELGEDYQYETGQGGTDYTYVSSDILEIGLLAFQTYTNVFEQLKYEDRPGKDQWQVHDRTKRLTTALYDPENGLNKLGNDYKADRYLKQPIDNFFYEIHRKLYRNQESVEWFPENEFKPKTPYYKVKEHEYNERMRDLAMKKQKKIQQAEEEKKMREERDRLEAEELERNKDKIAQEKFEARQNAYDSYKKHFPYVKDFDDPEGVDAVFYTYFDKFAERMGIDKSQLNAQSILHASSSVYVEEMILKQTQQRVDDNEFLKKLAPIYRQIQYITYEAYAEKCATENRQMDMTIPAREVSDLMGALMYNMYPRALTNKRDVNVFMRLSHILQGDYYGARVNHEDIIKKEAVELAKERFSRRDRSYFVADAEARYDTFALERKSSNEIVADTAALVNAYAEMKKARENGDNHTATQEAHLKKEAMDAAYALEKRVETRYKSVWARFFRFVSYGKQKDELERVKGILGIPNEKRVADQIVESRVNDIFVDIGNVAAYKKERVAYATSNDVEKRLRAKIEKYTGPLPEIEQHELVDEEIKRVKIHNAEPEEELQEQQPIEQNVEQEKVEELSEEEKKKLEEEQRKIQEEKDRLEKERLKKEEEERKAEEQRKKEEDDKRREAFYANLRKEQEEEEKRIAKEKAIFKERKEHFMSRKEMHTKNLEKLKNILNEVSQKVETMTREEEDRKNKKQEKLDLLENNIRSLEDQILNENAINAQNLIALKDEYSKLSMQIVERRESMYKEKDNQKLQDLAVKEEKKIQAALDKAIKKEEKKNPGKPVDKTKLGVDTTNKYREELEKKLESDPTIKEYRDRIFTIEGEIDGIDRNTQGRQELLEDFRKELKNLKGEREPVNLELESSKKFLDYMKDAVQKYEENADTYAWEGLQHTEYIKICEESPENPYIGSHKNKVAENDKPKSKNPLKFL